MNPGPHHEFLENLVEELLYLAIIGSLVLAARPTLYPQEVRTEEGTYKYSENILSDITARMEEAAKRRESH